MAAIKNKQRSPYSSSLFDIQKVYHYLTDSSWGRKLSENGRLNFWGTRYTVGKKYKSQMVTVTMDAPNQQWLVRDDKANIIYTGNFGEVILHSLRTSFSLREKDVRRIGL